MTHHDRDPVREFVERARELRRREQPPPELFEAALGRLIREQLGRKELAREQSRRFSLSRALSVVPRSLFRIGPLQLGLALALTLAVVVSWRARRQGALDPQPEVPSVALAAEPTPVHDATRRLELDHSAEQPSAEPGPALSAAPAAPPSPQPAPSESARPAPRQATQRHADPARAKTSGKKTAGAPRAVNCDPPWYIDARGIQRAKPKCL